MNDQIKLIKRAWKTGATFLVVSTMFLGGLALNLSSILATGTPSLFVTHLGTNISEPPTGDWSHGVSTDNGDFVQLYAEVGTHVDAAAENVNVRFDLPSGLATSGQSVVHATSSTSGVSERTDTVNWDFRGATCKLAYVGGSASARVDRNRDGSAEADGPISDSIVTSGVNFGTFTNGVVQVTFKARVECQGPAASPSPSPSPSPTPTPTPTPAPPTGGQNQEQNQQQTQNNEQNQTVNVTNTNTNTVNVPEVRGASVPLKQPETGVSTLGMASMMGAAPVGFALSRFGRGRSVVGKREESLGEIAFGLVNKRLGRNQDA